METSFNILSSLLKPLSALLRWTGQFFFATTEETDLDDSIISISANRMHF